MTRSVIAVGEVKSSLNTAGLNDSFEKISSVKRLQRHFSVPHPDLEFLPTGERVVNYRHYGSNSTPDVQVVTKEGQDKDEYSQIFGFVVSGNLDLSKKTFFERFIGLVNEIGDDLSPNVIAILDGIFVHPVIISDMKSIAQISAKSASHYSSSEPDPAFRSLIRWIFLVYRSGKTSDAKAFDRYLVDIDSSAASSILVPKKR